LKALLFILFICISQNAISDFSIMVDRYVLESEASPITCPAFLSLLKTKDDCELLDNPGVDDCVNVPIAPCELLLLGTDINFPSISIREDLLYPGAPGSPTLPTITSSDFAKFMVTPDFGTPGQLLQTDGDFGQDWTPYTFPTADGTANQILTSDGAGTLTFQDPPAPGGTCKSCMTLQIDSELNNHNSTGCPGFGKFNMNNDSPALVTLIRFRDNNHNPQADSMNIRMLFEFGKTGDYITFQDRDDNGTRTEIYRLTADAVQVPNCLNLTVEHIFDSGDVLLEGQISRVFFKVNVDP